MSNIRFYSPSTKLARAVSFALRARLDSRWCTRGLHHRRALLYKLEDGLGEFLPPPALKSVAVDWQQGLLDRLNDEVRGTEDQGLSLAKTVINTAGYEDKTLAFNYASLALNNGFFLDHLKPPPPSPLLDHSADISLDLAQAMRYAYGDVAHLKSEFSAAALGMFTSGWIWFVINKAGQMAVYPTYGPGTLLIRSRTYMPHAKGPSLGDIVEEIEDGGQEVGHEYEYDSGEQFEPSEPSSPARSPIPQPLPPGVSPSSPLSGVAGSRDPSGSNPLHPRFYSTFELETQPSSIHDEPEMEEPMTKTDLLNVEEVLYPLFCISVHEHAWMSAGYGVWGKEEWLKKFWTVLDWGKVSKSYEAIAQQQQQRQLRL